MTGLGIMMIAIVALAVGYFGYARWLEKTWGIDPNRPTPAVEKNDGKDTVLEIATECGFNSLSSYYRALKDSEKQIR